jgi:hypothetical protein
MASMIKKSKFGLSYQLFNENSMAANPQLKSLEHFQVVKREEREEKRKR